MQIVERRIRDYTAISEELSLQVEGVRSCPGPKNGHLAEKSAEVGLGAPKVSPEIPIVPSITISPLRNSHLAGILVAAWQVPHTP
jgi:hypothetical protein